jgi:hypothetical protein
MTFMDIAKILLLLFLFLFLSNLSVLNVQGPDSVAFYKNTRHIVK